MDSRSTKKFVRSILMVIVVVYVSISIVVLA